jgi:hypothetical protein
MKFVELFLEGDDVDGALLKAPQPLNTDAQELLQQLLDYYDLSSPRSARLKILEKCPFSLQWVTGSRDVVKSSWSSLTWLLVSRLDAERANTEQQQKALTQYFDIKIGQGENRPHYEAALACAVKSVAPLFLFDLYVNKCRHDGKCEKIFIVHCPPDVSAVLERIVARHLSHWSGISFDCIEHMLDHAVDDILAKGSETTVEATLPYFPKGVLASEVELWVQHSKYTLQQVSRSVKLIRRTTQKDTCFCITYSVSLFLVSGILCLSVLGPLVAGREDPS